MGKAEGSIWDVPLIKGKPTLVVVIFFFVLGGLVGILVVGQLQQQGSQSILEYLTPLVEGVEQGEIDAPSSMALLWEHGRWFLLLLLASLTPFGMFAIPLLVLLRGFIIGYTSAILLCLFGTQGMVVALVLVTLPELVILPALLFLGGEGLLHAKDLALKSKSTEQGLAHIKWLSLPVVLPCLLALLGTLCIEFWIVPPLLGWIV